MKNPSLKISNRIIGYDYEPVVIAEIGINHGGSLDIAINMAEAAINAGAEIIKHQTHIIEDEMSEEAKKVIPGNASISIYEIINKCSLNEKDEKKLMQYVNSKKCIFISTPFSRKAVDRLVKFNVPAFKIGSGECNNYPLIEYIAKFKKPMIISTGMNDIASIRKTVKIVEKYKVKYALLHCTNVYPTPPELVRLEAINVLKKNFPRAVIGLSDHTTTNFTSYGAIALGSSIIEKHFTDLKNRKGPDIVCSMTPRDLKEMIIGNKIIFDSRGSLKKPIKEEKKTIDFAFASVVSIQTIKKGQKFSRKNIWLKKPATGDFKSKDYNNLLGKIAKKNINKNTQISFTDVKK